MRRPLISLLVAVATSLSLLAAPGALPVSSASRAASSLTIGPDVFVGGQSLTFTGVLDGAPRARLQIETLFSRNGATWSTRDGVVATTDDQGAFAFEHPAPSNYGISYRLRADNGLTTPAVFLEPRQQEVVLSLDGGEAQAPGHVVSGEQFVLDVDTTPTGRGNLGRPAPPFPGRGLTLQLRNPDLTWRTVATTTASETGAAAFELVAGNPGATSYRVVMDDLTTDGHRIGWFPSFPLLVTVVATEAEIPAPPTGPEPPRTPPSIASGPGSGHATPTAGQRYRWGPALFDFAWEAGESLTDRPESGTRREGQWVDSSDGSGRVAHYNGGMALSTHISEFPGDGDLGTTTATLQGNPMTYGRWEFRRRIDVFEDDGADHRITIDLVPTRPTAGCANVINVADVSFNSATARLGVSSERAGRSWSGERAIPRLGDGPHTFGVEVTRRHVTWFLDGRSIATVKGRKVAPGVPLTPRLSLVGDGDTEMRRTRVLYDWQRGWELNKQAQRSEDGPSLPSRALRGGAC